MKVNLKLDKISQFTFKKTETHETRVIRYANHQLNDVETTEKGQEVFSPSSFEVFQIFCQPGERTKQLRSHGMSLQTESS